MGVLMKFEIFFILLNFCSITPGQEYDAQVLDLFEGDICQRGLLGRSSDYICRPLKQCPGVRQLIKRNIIPRLCSLANMIVCCPPSNIPGKNSSISPNDVKLVETYSASEMCRQYAEVINDRFEDSVKNTTEQQFYIVGGTVAEPKEFPHMALIGYGNTRAHVLWNCGGSLISNKWILTAAHCEKMGTVTHARWARLGDLNFELDTDDAKPSTYDIVKRVIHPDYRVPSVYNDIALFLLDRVVEFSEYVVPICLNEDQSFTPTTSIATGWGQVGHGGPQSSELLKVCLNKTSLEECNTVYATSVDLPYGVLSDSQICAGFIPGGKDTCGGDSGGPLQVPNSIRAFMYTQVGITSTGKPCGEANTPGIYTRVSKYVSWIEQSVWPKNCTDCLDINITKMKYFIGLILILETLAAQTNNDCHTPNNEQGVCIKITQCSPLLDMAQHNRQNMSALIYLRKSNCGTEDKIPKVCCKIDKPKPEIPQKNVTVKLNHATCGRNNVSSNKITGGAPAKLGAWPWMAALGYQITNKPDQSIKWLCGGALISERHVLTAAHCVSGTGPKKLRTIRVGDLDLDPDVNDGASPVDVMVEEIMAHESYNFATHDNDIAMIKLKTSVKYNGHVQPICLPAASNLRSSTFEKTTPFVAGWGSTTFNGPKSNALLEIQIPVVSNVQCKIIFDEVININDRMLCAGNLIGGKDACQGDSGGPLMSPIKGQYYLSGIVSFGIKCAEPGYPGVYTRVTHYIDWIEMKMTK
ncbi:uncharacterized protein LOC126841436 [Adelges cooleyi]|uniref:uncharacterized protein LOC126841436 n=1 Tax=Adelges cooleyi TaxID=133065 RepID=UPI00217FDAF8|nr:uncharacterized protein LOC126841436 [Adelges cooleyi]